MEENIRAMRNAIDNIDKMTMAIREVMRDSESTTENSYYIMIIDNLRCLRHQLYNNMRTINEINERSFK